MVKNLDECKQLIKRLTDLDEILERDIELRKKLVHFRDRQLQSPHQPIDSVFANIKRVNTHEIQD